MRDTKSRRLAAAGLLLAMVMTVTTVVSPQTAYAATEDYTAFTVYFPLYIKLGSFVYPVRYLIPVTSEAPKAAIEALIAGIPGAPFVPLPKDATVLSVSIADGVCTVDFSDKIRNVNVGSGGESAIIHAIVQTLLQFQDVSSVRILVEGEPLDTLAGHVDIRGPIFGDELSRFQLMDDAYRHWSGGAVGALIMLEVLDGYPDGTYKPDEKVTRAEFIKMLVEGLGLPNASGEAVPFADVAGEWHEDYVRRALKSGLIKATDYGDNLNPDEVIPREEMAALLVTASAAYLVNHPEVSYEEMSAAPVFSDISTAAAKYHEDISECAKYGFLRGFDDGTFRPQEGLNRGEAATVITRVLGMPQSEDIVRILPVQGADWDGGDLNALGAARAFEANVNWRIANEGGDILYSYTTSTEGMGWGLFGLHVDAELFASQSPTLFELFLVSPKDGDEYGGVKFSLAK